MSFSVKYFPNQLSHINSDLLALYRFDELSNSWITLESTIDPIAGTVTASTTELGYFSLQAPLICQDSLYEPNDLYDGAILINYGQGSITESFDTYQDEDWFRIDGFNGINYIIKTLDLAEDVDTILTVYNSDGITIINSDDNSGGGFSSLLSFTADQNDTYFIRVSKSSISSFGCNSSYKLDIKNDSKLIFIPLIYK